MLIPGPYTAYRVYNFVYNFVCNDLVINAVLVR